MTFPIHKLDDSNGEPVREWLDGACQVLSEGQLVALPTETVYGLAARADDATALARLAEIKGRPGGIAWTWHIGAMEALEAFPGPQATVRRLVERYWPGPLTLILPGVPAGLELAALDGWTGVRFTAEPFARALCTHASFPVVMTSANLHGQPAASDVAGLERLDTSLLGLVIDGGQTRIKEASTILKIGPGSFELLRAGLHDIEALRRTAGRRIAFICTGNTCRSPMAEALARQVLAERLACDPEAIGKTGVRVRSMGVFASSGAPATAAAREAMGELSLDISAHASSPALPEVIADFDQVFCMTESHRAALATILEPGILAKVTLLDPQQRDVPDPIGGGLDDYRRCARHIADCITRHADDWV